MDNKKQIDKWKTAATVGAFAALALIVFSYWIGTDTWIKCVVVAICSVFAASAVLWWYWALNQIAQFAEYIGSLKTTIKELKDDLKNIRKDI